VSALTTLFQKLRDLYASGLLDDDEYAAKLDRLRAQFTPAAVDVLVNAELPHDSPASTTQIIGGQANLAVAIGRDHYGHIFLDGQRADGSAALLHAYLERVAAACDTIALQPFQDKRDLRDAAAVGLADVYTELTTRAGPVERERYAGDELAVLDIEAFLQEHIGPNVLPRAQRVQLRRPLTEEERVSRAGTLHARGNVGTLTAAPDSLDMSLPLGNGSQFTSLREQVPWLAFLGPELVTEAIAASRRLVLLGEPGSGKSTVLRYLALTLARAALDEQVRLGERLAGWQALGQGGKLLPIVVPLLPFARTLDRSGAKTAGAKELWNSIAGELEGQGRYPGLAAAVHTELDAGRALLLLDGLDEVATEAARRLVIRAVTAFAAAYRNCRIVVSCRVRAYEGEHNAGWQLPGWPTATLADWTPAQMRHFVDAWYSVVGGLPPDERERRRADLQAALVRRDDLRRLGVNPMLLTIMALVHFNDSTLPEERAALYGRCVDILLARWELGRAEIGYASEYGSLMDYIGMPEADVKSLRPLLQSAAFEAQRATSSDSPGSLSRDRLRILLADALERRHTNPHEAAKRFLEYTDMRAGLIQARGAGDEYVFPHQTFQEYLAGLHLVSGPGFVDQIMALRGEDRWRVPIFLGIGQAVYDNFATVPYQLLNRLRCMTGREEAQRQRDLILAAEIAEDVGWARLKRSGDEFGQLQTDLARELAAVVEGSTLPARERIRAGELLGGLGDLRPGVCDLSPRMVQISGGRIVLGLAPLEVEPLARQFVAEYSAARNEIDEGLEEAYRGLFDTWVSIAPVDIGPYELASYLLTNAQYKHFVEAGGYDPTAPWWSDAARAWLRRDDLADDLLSLYRRRLHKDQPEYWDNPRFGIARPNHPVVGISWYEATAFCTWLTLHLDDGSVYRLPSEAEWEYAARGAARRSYPWGEDAPGSERANSGEVSNGTTAVGCFPLGATPGTRLLDMAGNVWEWTRSVYRPYPYDPNDGREDVDDPENKRFTLRGGSWSTLAFLMRAVNRDLNMADGRDFYIGLRLARYGKL
jgi:formylglycine-generating enzyme required for sulfatase activity/Mrp family chromosome partitioning ATPase